jgi:hypothetical protein
MKLRAHSVVRIIVKTLIFPKLVYAWRYIPLAPASAPQLCDVRVPNLEF